MVTHSFSTHCQWHTCTRVRTRAHTHTHTHTPSPSSLEAPTLCDHGYLTRSPSSLACEVMCLETEPPDDVTDALNAAEVTFAL